MANAQEFHFELVEKDLVNVELVEKDLVKVDFNVVDVIFRTVNLLNDIGDVDTPNPQDDQGIFYNATTGKWENKSISS